MLQKIQLTFVPATSSQAAYNKIVGESLAVVAAGLSGLYFILTFIELLSLPQRGGLYLIIRLILTLAFLGIFFQLRRRRLPAFQAHPLVAVIAGLVLIDLMIRLYGLGGFPQSISFVWLTIGIGSVFLSLPWFWLALATTALGWIIAAILSPIFSDWVQLITSLITGVAVAIIIQFVRLNTYERLENIRRQLQTSKEVSRQVGSILEPGILLSQAVDLIKSEFNYDYVGIFLIPRSSLRIEAYAEMGGSHTVLAETGKLFPGSPHGLAIERQESIHLHTNHKQHSEWLLSGMQFALVLPLIVGDRIMGVLDLQSQQPIPFDQDNVSAMQSLADQLAIILRNAIRYEREETSSRLSQTLFQISLALLGTLDRDEILDLILENLNFIVPYDRGSLLLHKGDELEIVAARGFPTDSKPTNIRVPLIGENDLFVQIYHTQQPLLIKDISQHPTWKQINELPAAKSFLGVPLLRGHEVTGMLSLVREDGEAYTEEDMNPATSFASQAVVALENAMLYDEIARVNAQLEYEVQQRTKAMMQIAMLDQAKSDFINVTSHELRTPLTTMKGYVQMLLSDSSIKSNEYHHQIVEGIYQGTLRLHEIINSLLNVAKIDNKTLELHPQELAIAHVVEQICLELEESVQERHLTINYEALRDLPHIVADLDGLKQIFFHLIINAVKYTPDGGTITVSGRPLAADEAALPVDEAGVEIIVSDTGIGIDPGMQELIFTKFYQTGKISLHSSGKTKFKGGGPGLGLAIVRGIIEAHHGRVWADSPGHDEKALPGSHFHVVLPLGRKHKIG